MNEEISSPVAAAEVAKVAGESKLDESLSIEIDLLSAIAIDKIANSVVQEAARALSARQSSATILVASNDTVSHLSAARLLRAELASLNDAIAGHLKTRKQEAFEAATIAGATSAILGGVAEMLSWLRVDTSWTGRQSDIGAVLIPSIAGKLVAAGRRCVILDDLLFRGNAVEAFVAAVQQLREGRAELAAEVELGSQDKSWLGTANALVGSADAWFSLVAPSAPGEVSKLANSVALAFSLDPDDILILSAVLIRAGGNYRIRRHLFSTLFGNGGLTFSAGALVTYQLRNLQTGEVLLSATAHSASGHVRFPSPSSPKVPLSSSP